MAEEHDKNFERGKKDGGEANIMDEIAHGLSSTFSTTKKDKSYDAGWEKGIKNKK